VAHKSSRVTTGHTDADIVGTGLLADQAADTAGTADRVRESHEGDGNETPRTEAGRSHNLAFDVIPARSRRV